MLVLVPSGGTQTRQGRRLLVDGVVIDYNATLLPDNLVRNPDVDSAISNNSNRPSFWHYSTNAIWSAQKALSPTHSLELVDNSASGNEEWRAYATGIPAGADRSLQLRWFWQYAVAAGGEFRARLRLSNDDVTSLDLTNPLLEYNFNISGTSADFEIFETLLALPNGIRSFDLTFISGGTLGATGTIYIDDISAAIVTGSTLLGDYNHNGIVDAADYIVWRTSFGLTGSGLAADGNSDNAVTQLDFDIWRKHFGEAAGAATVGENSPVPETSTAILSLFGFVAALGHLRRTQRC
jgi:hypothetical protein